MQYVHVHQLDEFASRDCGKAKVEVMIRDSIGPAASEEATKRLINTAKIDRIGIRFLALRLQRPANPAGRKSSGELLLNLSNGRTCDRAVCHNFMTIGRISPSKVGSMPRKPSVCASGP